MADIYNLIPNEGFKYSLQVNDLNLFLYLEIGLEMIIAQNSKYLELCFMVIARDATGNPGNPFPEVPGRFSPTRSPRNIICLNEKSRKNNFCFAINHKFGSKRFS